ncbi:MAG: rhamnan synthesis protein F [Clostridia bacterium]|nr:rhamnan synthesis protein F [Clostridia bacterium]
MKRAILYFFYDGEGIADECNFYMLRDLRKSAEKIYVVVNGLLTAESKKKFEQIADDVFVRENKGLDVWAYKEGMEHIGWDKVTTFDEFIMMNHTNYGPVHPFAEMFAEMDKRDVDFWGITKHNGHSYDPYNACEYGYIPPHIQSSFIAVRKRMMLKKAYRQYWDEMPMINGYVDSICRHEAVFTEKFKRLGFESDVYVNTDDLAEVCDYPLMMMPVELIKNRRCPVFKRKSFFNIIEELMDVTCGQATVELYDYLRNETDFDVNMIWDNLLRTANMWDIKQRMQLNYVLPRDVEKPLKRQPKVALFMHIYYPEMIPELRGYADQTPEYADIYISTNTEEKKALIEKGMEGIGRKCRVIVVENRGREYAGFFIGMRKYVSQYDYICIAHGKKSRYEKPYIIGDSFSYHCFENTLSSRAYTNNVLATFEENPRLGLLVPPTPEHGMYYTTVGREWRGNFGLLQEKCKQWNIKAPMDASKPPVAPLGGFFWFRTAALKKIFDVGFKYEDFPQEPCREIDGTIMHVIERIYPFVAQDAGYYSAWVLSDRYSAMRLTADYKSIRDINEMVFWVHGEGDRHAVLHRILQGVNLSGAENKDTVTTRYLVRTLIKRFVGPKWCARYRRTMDAIQRSRRK